MNLDDGSGHFNELLAGGSVGEVAPLWDDDITLADSSIE